MEQSILKHVKKLVNVGPDDTSFDLDIMTHINSAFGHLQQLGIGPEAGFAIESDEAKWTDFFPEATEIPIRSEVQANIGMQVRLIFDPPEASHAVVALERLRERSDFRLLVWREENEWVDPAPPDFLVVDGGNAAGED